MRYIAVKKFTADLNQLLIRYCLDKKLTAKILLEKMQDKKGLHSPEGIFYTTTEKVLEAMDMSKKFKQLNDSQLEQLLSDIEKFLDKYQLGKNWTDTLCILLVSGELLVPTANFDLDYRFEPKRLTIELNKTTTLKDIEEYFSEIKKKQKEIWQNSKRENLTKNSFSNFEASIFRDKEKKSLADKKLRESFTTYEEIIYNKKDVSISEKLRIIKQNRKEQGKKSKKPISLNKKASDTELAEKLLTEKGNKKLTKDMIRKKTNQIRQIASREKNKLNLNI